MEAAESERIEAREENHVNCRYRRGIEELLQSGGSRMSGSRNRQFELTVPQRTTTSPFLSSLTCTLQTQPTFNIGNLSSSPR